MAKSVTELQARGIPEIHNGTATTTAATITFTRKPKSITIVNQSTTVQLQYSFDGSTYAVLLPGSAIGLAGEGYGTMYIKTESKTAGYSITVETKIEGAV